MTAYKALFILGLTGWLIAISSFAQDAKLDEAARVALARGANQQVIAIITQLESAGSPLSALNAYRAALAAERLQNAVAAERYLIYAIQQDPTLKFATSADKVLALKQKIASKLQRPFDDHAGLNTPRLEPVVVEEKAGLPTETSQPQDRLEREKKILAAQYEALQDQVRQMATRNAAVIDSGVTPKVLVSIVVAIGIANGLILLLIISSLLIMRRSEKRRSAELAALQQICPGPKAFRELAQELYDRLKVAEELLCKEHRNTAFYSSVSIALPAIQEYLEQTKPDGATFVSHPSLLPTQPLAGLATQRLNPIAPQRASTA